MRAPTHHPTTGALAKARRANKSATPGPVAACRVRFAPAETEIAERGPRAKGIPARARATNERASESSRIGGVETSDDDDVLAAQLREAAQRERDPVLQEKLWAEYRKYKASKR